MLDYKLPVSSMPLAETLMPITTTGTAHCVALWVDYTLLEGSQGGGGGVGGGSNDDAIELNHFDENSQDFPAHLTLSLVFFKEPINVVAGASVLKSASWFNVGDSDISTSFEFCP